MGVHVRAGGCAAAASEPLWLGDACDGYVVPRHRDLALAGTKGPFWGQPPGDTGRARPNAQKGRPHQHESA